MSDIPLPSQMAASQALMQLSQLSASADLAKQGVEVLVKHLGDNLVSLNKDTNFFSKTVTLTADNVKTALADGQKYQLRLSSKSPLALEFYSTNTTQSKTSPEVSKSSFLLTEQQINNLLKLPAKQLLSGINLNKIENAVSSLQLQATVLSTKNQGQLNDALKHTQQTANTAENGSVITTANNKQANILPLRISSQGTQSEISLSLKQTNPFQSGEKVTITLTPKGNNWQVTLAKLTSTGVNDSVQLSLKHLEKQPANQHLSQPLQASPKREQTNQQTIIPASKAQDIIKQALQQHSLNTTNKLVEVSLPIKQVLQQLVKSEQPESLAIIQKIKTSPIQNINLQLTPSGDAKLSIQSQKPVVTIPISPEIAKSIMPLKIPGQEATLKTVSQSIVTSGETASPTKLNKEPSIAKTNMEAAVVTKPIDSKPVVSNTNKPESNPEIKVSLKDAALNLAKEVQEKPISSSVITPQLLNNKPQQANLLQSLLRIVQAKADAPAASLQGLDKALVDTEFLKAPTETSTKQVLEQLLNQVKQALPQGKELDHQNIKQLLTAPILNLSSTQLTNPAASQGLFSGLVTMLQISLSARLARGQAQRSEFVAETLNKVIRASGKAGSTTPKGLQEFSQLEQKHQLIRDIGRLMSGHQANKLSSAEQSIQGQETFYYNLPSIMGGTMKDVELLIKRESEQQEGNEKEPSENKTWQLTMKLSVGEMGELLTKAKLRPDNIDLNFYVSNDDVKIQVMNYLPLLRRKLDSLGIKVNKSECQLGKIPDTLAQRPYHVFQTQA
ncbi:MAG: flagellar hook-length control protein FliK [Paraglaciecola sp.]|uniref:flagellar hook-length control protein FliK n=1 Tax=Paraglaciecola sp. TaxID=1920173 RepID=UPI00326662C7